MTILLDERVRDLLRLEVVLRRGLHELDDLLLDGVVPLEDGLVRFLHLELELVEEGVVQRGGVELLMVLGLGQERMGHLAAEHFLHLGCLELLQLQGQLADLFLLVDGVLEHLAGTGYVWLKLSRVEIVGIQYLLEKVGLHAVSNGCLAPPHLYLRQPH